MTTKLGRGALGRIRMAFTSPCLEEWFRSLPIVSESCTAQNTSLYWAPDDHIHKLLTSAMAELPVGPFGAPLMATPSPCSITTTDECTDGSRSISNTRRPSFEPTFSSMDVLPSTTFIIDPTALCATSESLMNYFIRPEHWLPERAPSTMFSGISCPSQSDMRVWSNRLYASCRRALGARADILWLALRLAFWLLKRLEQSPSEPNSRILLGVCVVSCKWYDTAVDDPDFWHRATKNELEMTRISTIYVLQKLNHCIWDAPEETDDEKAFYHEFRHAAASISAGVWHNQFRKTGFFREQEWAPLFPGLQVNLMQ